MWQNQNVDDGFWETHRNQHMYNDGHDIGNGIELNIQNNGINDVGFHQDHIYHPYWPGSGQEPEQHYHCMYSQMMTNHLLPSSTPVQSSLSPLILSPSPLPQSCCMQHPSTTIIQPLPPPPPPALAMGCNAIHQYHQQHINRYDYNESNTRESVVKMVKNESSSSCFRHLPPTDRNTAAGMTSTVIVNNNVSQTQQPSNNVKMLSEISHTTKQTEKSISTVNDDKVANVCKRAVVVAVQKIIADDYRSALYKLRKVIRVLDVLMFNEDGNAIGSANVETLRPWMETLKDMEQRISLKHQQKNNSESNVTSRVGDGYQRFRYRSLYNSGSHNNDNIGRVYNRFYRSAVSMSRRYRDDSCHLRRTLLQSKPRRYRTTGNRFTTEQQQNDLIR